jgi:7,8-dihydropterin-6-yl-methyl-4-(beta-D-ribofuranosyl)aminobenzene 5'-phosphate synthase
VIDTLEYVR